MTTYQLGRVLGLSFGMAAIALTNGCAFGTRYVALKYDPVTALQAPSPGIEVGIVKFSDAREKPGAALGEVRNGWGIKTASVVAKDQDLGAWVANALAEELTKAGCQVKKYSDAVPPDIEFSIAGSVPETYVRSSFNHRATVRVSVVGTRAGVVCLNKQYTGKAKASTGMAAAVEYERVLGRSLQNVMKQLVPDVIAAMR